MNAAANMASAAEATLSTDDSSNRLYSVSLSNAWKLVNDNKKNVTARSNKNQATTYRLQIQGDSITATPDNGNLISNASRSTSGLGKNPASVARRNARERRRIKNVNSAFDELRQHVPNGDRNRKKISKVDTLQSAIEYIKALEELVRSRRSATTSEVTMESDKENAPSMEMFRQSSPGSPGSPMEMSDVKSSSESESDDVIFVKQTNVAAKGDNAEKTGKQRERREISGCAHKKENSKQRRPAEITESMLKAFDVMLQKCSARKNSDANSETSVAENTFDRSSESIPTETSSFNSSLALDSAFDSNTTQALKCDSGFSELFSDQPDHENPDFGHSVDVNSNQRIRQSSLDESSNFNQKSPVFEQVASPILSEGPAFDTQLMSQVFSPDVTQMQANAASLDAQLSVAAVNRTVTQDQRADAFAPLTDCHNDNAVMENCTNQNATNVQLQSNALWYNTQDSFQDNAARYSRPSNFDVISSSFHDESFDLQGLPGSSAIDQINPTITFLPDFNCSYNLNYSTPGGTEQSPSQYQLQDFALQRGSDNSWILAQLN